MAVWAYEEGRKEEGLGYSERAAQLERSADPPCYGTLQHVIFFFGRSVSNCTTGPPMDPVKPSSELHAELLLRSGRVEEALRYFEDANFNFPNRLRFAPYYFLGVSTPSPRSTLTLRQHFGRYGALPRGPAEQA